MIKITIPLDPRTKKNSQQIFRNRKTGKPFISQSEIYKQYVKDCGYFLKNKVPEPIDYPVNVKALYYRETRRRVDITNLHSCLHDVLVEHGILEDDNSNIVVGTDRSRVFLGDKNPRTEIEILEV